MLPREKLKTVISVVVNLLYLLLRFNLSISCLVRLLTYDTRKIVCGMTCNYGTIDVYANRKPITTQTDTYNNGVMYSNVLVQYFSDVLLLLNLYPLRNC